MPKNNQNFIQPDEGDVVYLYYKEAEKGKLAINLEPYSLHKNKDTFNGVLTTSQGIDNLYPYDYPILEPLQQGQIDKPTKVLCDTPALLFKENIIRKIGRVSQKDLNGIRKKVAPSLGITSETLLESPQPQTPQPQPEEDKKV